MLAPSLWEIPNLGAFLGVFPREASPPRHDRGNQGCRRGSDSAKVTGWRVVEVAAVSTAPESGACGCHGRRLLAGPHPGVTPAQGLWGLIFTCLPTNRSPCPDAFTF